MDTITFFVPGPIVSQRLRNVRVGTWLRSVPTEECKNKKAQVQMCAAAAMRPTGELLANPPLMGPLEVTIKAYRVKPASWPKKRWAWVQKQDADNIAKLVSDGCNGIIWGDDAQIVRLIVEKRHAAAPGIQVSAREITEEELR